MTSSHTMGMADTRQFDPKWQAMWGGSGMPSGGGGGFGGVDFSQYMQAFAPKTPAQLVAEMNAAEAAMPASVQLAAAQAASDPSAAMAHFMNTQGKQMIAQAQAGAAARGRDNSTFGAADVAFSRSLASQGAYAAGQDHIDRAMNRWRMQRKAYDESLQPLISKQNSAQAGADFALRAAGMGLDRDKFAWEQDKYNRERGDSKRAGMFNLAAQAGPSIARGIGNAAKSAWRFFGPSGHTASGGMAGTGTGFGGIPVPDNWAYMSGGAPSGLGFGMAPAGVAFNNNFQPFKKWNYGDG